MMIQCEITVAAIVDGERERERTVSRKEILEDSLVSVSCVCSEAAFSNSLLFNVWSLGQHHWYYQGAG